MTLSMFISLRKRYMVSNKLLVLGLRNSLLCSRLLDLFLVVMILLFLLSAMMQVISFYLYMLMTWLLPVITLMVFQFWRQSWLDIWNEGFGLSLIFSRYWDNLLTQRLPYFLVEICCRYSWGLDLLITRL
jgi:hypothetical protein